MENTMNPADENAITQIELPPDFPERADLKSSLLTFDPAFQSAITQSLATGGAVEVRTSAPMFPENHGELDTFCKQALSGCPLSIELTLLNRRRMNVSLNWVAGDRSTVVSVRAADITELRRKEESEATKHYQREIDYLVEQSLSQRQLRG